MTPDTEALARRAVACKGWRWMPGMLAVATEVCGYAPPPQRLGQLFVEPSDSRTWFPDLTDPATLGCLLALVLEAWGRPTAFLHYYGGNWFFDPQQSEPTNHFSGRTEAEALVAALEAAP